MGHGRGKFLQKDGMIRTLPIRFHIPNLAKNLIYVKKISGVSVHIVFEKEDTKRL